MSQPPKPSPETPPTPSPKHACPEPSRRETPSTKNENPPPKADGTSPTTKNEAPSTKNETPPSLPPSVPPSQAAGAPTHLSPKFQTIPPQLAAIDHWGTWRYERASEGGGWNTSFFLPGRGRAIYNDFRSWTTFRDANGGYEFFRVRSNPYHGVSFALADGFVAIELNNVFPPDPERRGVSPTCPQEQAPQHASELNERSPDKVETLNTKHETLPPKPETKNEEPTTKNAASRSPLHWAQTLVHDLKTYTELTPDGRGLLLIICGDLPNPLDSPLNEPTPHPEGGTFTIHSRHGSHVCITGRKWPSDSGYAVEDRINQVRQIARKLHQGTKLETLYPGAPPPPPPAPPPRVDEGISIRAINPFAGVPTMEELRAKRKAEERKETQRKAAEREAEFRNRPPDEDRPIVKTREQLQAEEAERRFRYRRHKHPERGKPPTTDEILEFAFDKFILARSPTGEPFAVERGGPNIARMFKGGADPLGATLNRCVIRDLGRAAKPTATNAALALLQAEALGAPKQEVHLRVADVQMIEVPDEGPVPTAESQCATGGAPGPHGQSNAAPTNEEQEQAPKKASGQTETPNTKHQTLPKTKQDRRNHHRSKLNRKQRRSLEFGRRNLARPTSSIAGTTNGPEASPPLISPNTIHENSSSPSAPAPPSPPSSEPPSSFPGLAVDLGRDDGRLVAVSHNGWIIEDHSTVPFYRTNFTRELPLPESGGTLDDLRSLINISDKYWPHVRAWLVAAFVPSIAHPVLLLRGVEGSGKSTALRILSSLIDPSSAQLREPPKDSRRWAATAASSWCIAIDDVASIPPWFGKALDDAVNGYGFVCPGRYGADDTVLELRRVMAISGDDLLPGRDDPFVVIELEPIEDDRRLPETELWKTFQALKPRIFGALLDEVATMLRNLPEVRLEHPPNLADFTKILAALERAHAPCATGGASAPKIEEQEQGANNASRSVKRNPEANPPSPANPPPAPDASKGPDTSNTSNAPDTSAAPDTSDTSKPPNAPDTIPHKASAVDWYRQQRQRLAVEHVERDELSQAIAEFVRDHGPWRGTATDLLKKIDVKGLGRDGRKNTTALGRRLRDRISPLLATGISVIFDRGTGSLRPREIHITATRSN